MEVIVNTWDCVSEKRSSKTEREEKNVERSLDLLLLYIDDELLNIGW